MKKIRKIVSLPRSNEKGWSEMAVNRLSLKVVSSNLHFLKARDAVHPQHYLHDGPSVSNYMPALFGAAT